METKINRNMFIAILGVVLLVTVYNVIANPVSLEVAEDEFGSYNVAGAGFQGEKGMRFNYSRLGDGRLSYKYGLTYRLKSENNETDLNYISLTWTKSEPIDQLEAVTRSYNYSDPRKTEYTFGETVNETIHEHFILYSTFNKTSTDGNRTGYIGQWNCTNSSGMPSLLSR